MPKIQELQARLVDVQERAALICAKAESARRDLTDDESAEVGRLMSEFDQALGELGQLDRHMTAMAASRPPVEEADPVARVRAAGELLEQPRGRITDPDGPGGGNDIRGRVGVFDRATGQRTEGDPGGQMWFEDGRGNRIRALAPDDRLADLVPRQEPLSFARMVLGAARGDWSGAPREMKVFAEQSVGTGADGGWLAPPMVSSEIIDIARNQTRLIQAGARTIPMSSGEMTVAKVLQEPSAAWRPEHGAIPGSQVTFGRVLMRAQSLGAMITVSEELLEDAPNADSELRRLLGEALGLELDRAGLFGTGSGEPLGIHDTPGVQSVEMAVDGAVPVNFDEYLDAIAAIEGANGPADTVIYNARTKRTLAGLKTGLTGDQTPLMPPPDYTALRRLTTNQIPNDLVHGAATTASAAFVGGFSEVVLGVRSSLRLMTSMAGGEPGEPDAFAKVQLRIRAVLRADWVVFRPSLLCVLRGILAS